MQVNVKRDTRNDITAEIIAQECQQHSRDIIPHGWRNGPKITFNSLHSMDKGQF